MTRLDLETLVGMNRRDVEQRLGTAHHVADQPPALIWVYPGEECTLQIHFFLEVKRRVYRVLTTSLVGETGDEAARQACLDSVRTHRLSANATR